MSVCVYIMSLFFFLYNPIGKWNYPETSNWTAQCEIKSTLYTHVYCFWNSHSLQCITTQYQACQLAVSSLQLKDCLISFPPTSLPPSWSCVTLWQHNRRNSWVRRRWRSGDRSTRSRALPTPSHRDRRRWDFQITWYVCDCIHGNLAGNYCSIPLSLF